MKMDLKVKIITCVIICFFLAIQYFLHFHSGASYFPAWVLILIIAIFLLVALSIPRYTLVTHTAIEIHCLVELTIIPIGEIREVKQVSPREMGWTYPVPLLGMWGIFGYYGYYYSYRYLKVFRLYALSWKNFIMIRDKSGKVYIISCNNPKDFLADINSKLEAKSLG